jgi:hypothetical protein
LPPYVPYMLAFVLWLGLACLVWLVAIVLGIFEPTRPLAVRLSLAMAATFPGVWLFQIVVAPFALSILLIAWIVWRGLEPNLPETTENPVVIATFIAAVFIDFLLILGMSVLGFYEGWRTGWSCGKGRPWRDVVRQGPTARLMASATQRLKIRRNL